MQAERLIRLFSGAMPLVAALAILALLAGGIGHWGETSTAFAQGSDETPAADETPVADETPDADDDVSEDEQGADPTPPTTGSGTLSESGGAAPVTPLIALGLIVVAASVVLMTVAQRKRE